MPDAFDPYHKWLAIPPSEQPPNHYRLLGISPFETDPDVISNAADQRMVHIRTYQSGRYSALSQKLLNEVSAARLCLLDPQKRKLYDERLRPALPPGVEPAAESPDSVPRGSVDPAAVVTKGLPPAEQSGPATDSNGAADPASRITADDVSAAEQEWRSWEEKLRGLQQRQQQHRRRLMLLAAQLAWIRTLGRLRPIADKGPAGRPGVGIIVAGTCMALGVIGAGVLTLKGPALLAGGMLALVGGTALVIHALFLPPDLLLARWECSRREHLDRCWLAVEQLDPQIVEARRLCEEAGRRHQQLASTLAGYSTAAKSNSGA